MAARPQTEVEAEQPAAPASPKSPKGPRRTSKQQRGRDVEAGDGSRAKGKSKGLSADDFQGLEDPQARAELSKVVAQVESQIRDVDALNDQMKTRAARVTQAGAESEQAFETARAKLEQAQKRGKEVTDTVAGNQAKMRQALNWKPGTKAEQEEKRGMLNGMLKALGFGSKQKEVVVAEPTSMEAVLNEGSEMAVDIFFEVKTARDVLVDRKGVLEGAIRLTSNDRRLAAKDYTLFGMKAVEFQDLIDAKRAEQKAIVDAVGEESAKLTPEHATLEDEILKLDQYQQWVGRRMQFFKNAVAAYDKFISLATELQKTSRGMIDNADELLQTTAIEQLTHDQIASIVGALAKVAELQNNLRVALVGNKENARLVLDYAASEYAADQERTADMHTALRGMDTHMQETAHKANEDAEKGRRTFLDQAVAELRAGKTIKDRPVHLAPDARPVGADAALSDRVKRLNAAMASMDHGGQPTRTAKEVASGVQDGAKGSNAS